MDGLWGMCGDVGREVCIGAVDHGEWCMWMGGECMQVWTWDFAGCVLRWAGMGLCMHVVDLWLVHGG